MSISRRGALLGATAAAVVTGATTAPLAIKAAAAQADPVAVLVNKALTFRDWLNAIPGDMPEEEFNTQCDELWEMFDQIRDTPATSVEGIAGKVRVAYLQTEPSIGAERTGPPDDFCQIGQLAPERFIWSALKDLERLAGGMRS